MKTIYTIIKCSIIALINRFKLTKEYKSICVVGHNKEEIPIPGLELEDFDFGQIFDNEGYHCDYKVNDYSTDGNGIYEMSIENLGRSDKLSNE